MAVARWSEPILQWIFATHGLLNRSGNGVYISTVQGEQYLNGEVDADELPDTVDGDSKASA